MRCGLLARLILKDPEIWSPFDIGFTLRLVYHHLENNKSFPGDLKTDYSNHIVFLEQTTHLHQTTRQIRGESGEVVGSVLIAQEVSLS